jgi:hypothetical protein
MLMSRPQTPLVARPKPAAQKSQIIFEVGFEICLFPWIFNRQAGPKRLLYLAQPKPAAQWSQIIFEVEFKIW